MLTSALLSAIVLATGTMAQNYGGEYGYSSAIPKSSSTPESWETWTSSSTAIPTPTTEAWEVWASSSVPLPSVNAVAASTSSVWPTSSAYPSSALVQVVQVSTSNGSNLKYYPEKIQAPPGSWVQFQFYPKVCLTPVSKFLFPPQLTCNGLEPHGNAIHIQQPLCAHQQYHVQCYRYQLGLHARRRKRHQHARLLHPHQRHNPYLDVLRAAWTLPGWNVHGHQRSCGKQQDA